MSEVKRLLEFGEDDSENPAIFLNNPWNGSREVIAKFFWPTHPEEVTTQAERLIEELGAHAASFRSISWAEIVGCHQDRPLSVGDAYRLKSLLVSAGFVFSEPA